MFASSSFYVYGRDVLNTVSENTIWHACHHRVYKMDGLEVLSSF